MPRLQPVLTQQESIWFGQAINLAHAEDLKYEPQSLNDKLLFDRAVDLFWSIKARHKQLGKAVMESEQNE